MDAKSEGISLGSEEDKLGIKGSSTRQVFFNNVKVPVENLLGEIGKGHKIAFNVLNIGRYKLAVLNLGGSKKQSAYQLNMLTKEFSSMFLFLRLVLLNTSWQKWPSELMLANRQLTELVV